MQFNAFSSFYESFQVITIFLAERVSAQKLSALIPLCFFAILTLNFLLFKFCLILSIQGHI